MGRICGSRRGPRLRGRREADPEGMAACGQSLEGFAQMQCSLALIGRSCRRDYAHIGQLPNGETSRDNTPRGSGKTGRASSRDCSHKAFRRRDIGRTEKRSICLHLDNPSHMDRQYPSTCRIQNVQHAPASGSHTRRATVDDESLDEVFRLLYNKPMQDSFSVAKH